MEAPTIKIETWEDDGGYTYHFTYEGKTFQAWDFSTRERALEDARSLFRSILRNPETVQPEQQAA